MTQFTNFWLTLGAFGGAVIPLVSVIANPVQTVLVSYSDLDLGNEKDVRMLGRRISRAIEKVCGSYAEVSEISEIERIDKCRKAARKGVHHATILACKFSNVSAPLGHRPGIYLEELENWRTDGI